MIKAFKRLLALFGIILVVFGAIKSLFNWLARSESDEYEVWSDDEEREDVK
jgi:hypothetical protein